ncbi:MAG: bifunctional glutamate N-acetyltransferase/amino-acid acetyltransferase ArgJ [Phycisphaerales bacterium]|nr:bifunctional glutamate N-acetyltransferase/amino-acid acetyltransferase ArgJ [Phycisphaerales bacterium]MCI0675009.1 bifunctional glutamate N-acetyltransferase/amino-acid acetyltransferase ArgJ [Phycisphaerales bacterium]
MRAALKKPTGKNAPPEAESRIDCPAGFAAGGAACGIKPTGAADLALIVADQPASAAALFTRNLVRAAPIDISAQHIRSSKGAIRAVMISSGCANAATGPEGVRRAQRTVDALAKELKCDAREVLINSTGVIGEHLPDDKIVAAIPRLVSKISTDGLSDAMAAIMTTDTKPKMSQARHKHAGRTLHVAGIAKGSGMIHPNMATMIAVLLTDAQVNPDALDGVLRRATQKSFHRITVDGDTSTNDSVFALASGAAGEFPLEMVEKALTDVSRELALKIVRDGEGAKKLIHVQVREARTQDEALQVAKTIASSLLVRTAVAGGDPNWGRIIAAAGRSGVNIDPNRITVAANGVPLFANGRPTDTPLPAQQTAFQSDTVVLDIGLGQGSASDEYFTCDLTEGYVRINSHYRT